MARQFDGSISNYLGSTLELNLPSDWRILFRVKNVVSTGDHQIFFGRRGGDTNGWAVGRQASGEFTFWGFGGATGAAGTVATGSTSFDAYAITRVSSGTGTFYKNSTTALGTASITPGSSTGTGLNIGNMNNAGTPSFPAKSELAEVAIFSRVLNSTELGQWFSGDSPSLYDTGLVHYWKLDAASGGETATTGGYNLTQVGTVGSTTHPTMNYGSGSTDGTATGATLVGTSSLAAGSATGGAVVDGTATGTTLAGTSSLSAGAASGGTSGGFTSDAMENNTGAGLLANTSVSWTWYQGSIGAAPTSTTHGTGTTNASGVLTVSGLPTGAGFLLVRTADSSGVYYQPGTVT